jgi:DNA-binding Lrp family transcriptional regulator
LVAVADDDQGKPMITAHAHGRRLSGLGTLPPPGPVVPARPSVQAIARVRLGPGKPRQVFEWQLRAIPAVLSAVRVIGDVDYELRLACPDVADLSAVLTSLRGCGGAEVVSTALVLGEVAGLGQPRPAALDRGTRPRPCQTVRPADERTIASRDPKV